MSFAVKKTRLFHVQQTERSQDITNARFPLTTFNLAYLHRRIIWQGRHIVFALSLARPIFIIKSLLPRPRRGPMGIERLLLLWSVGLLLFRAFPPEATYPDEMHEVWCIVPNRFYDSFDESVLKDVIANCLLSALVTKHPGDALLRKNVAHDLIQYGAYLKWTHICGLRERGRGWGSERNGIVIQPTR